MIQYLTVMKMVHPLVQVCENIIMQLHNTIESCHYNVVT